MRNPEPVTPLSSKGSETPVLRKGRMLESPDSPMFTRDDQIRIHKKRTDLEMEVAALNQQLSGLRFEVKKVKSEMVSESELFQLKAQTRSALSVANSARIDDLMATFAEVVREVAGAAAMCETLDALVLEEAKQREQVVSEFTSLSGLSAFDGQDLRVPEVCVVHSKSSLEHESHRKQALLKETRDTLLLIEGGRPSHLEPDAALEIARASESHWKLKAAGTLPLRTEIQRLQRYLSESESQVRGLESAVEAERTKFEEAAVSVRGNESIVDERTANAKGEFVRQTENLDRELAHLKQRVLCSAASHDKIRGEIAELEVGEIDILDFNEDEDRDNEEEEDEDEGEGEDVEEETNSRDERLMLQRASIAREVANLEARYKDSRNRAKQRERNLTSDIKALKKRSAALADTRRRCARLPPDAASISSSPVRREIVSLFRKIDMSITDLRSDLNV